MGNECCTQRKKNSQERFTSKDLDTLKNLFNSFNLGDPDNHLNTTYLRPLFPENTQLADNICVFIKANSGRRPISFDSFQASLEVLTKENPEYQLKKYEELDKIDVLALIILDKASLTRQDMKSLKISTAQAYKYIETILSMFQHPTAHTPQINQDAVYTIVNAAFGKKFQGEIGWLSFLSYLNSNLPYLNRAIQSYFAGKFLHKTPTSLKLPDLSQNSLLLNQDLLSLLYLSNVYLHSANKLERIHSSRYGPSAFKDFANILINYDAPTIVLCKFSSYKKETYQSFSGILGGFNLSAWRNDGKYHGNSGCYIFSLTPKFHLYIPQFSNSSDAKKYTYLNNSEYGDERPGVGFGRTKDEKFRIWIDGLEPEKSYVEAQDETFCPGSLINEGSNSINIEYIEIWGLSSDMNLLTETDYLERSDSLITRKPWITFNQERLPKLSSTNPQVAQTLAGFDRKISNLHKSNESPTLREQLGDQSFLSPQRDHRELPSWNYREQPTNHFRSLSEHKPQQKQSRPPYETEKKSSLSPNPSIDRKTYSYPLVDSQPQRKQFSPTRGRESYSMTDGYYNPFKQRNVKIMRKSQSPPK